MKSIRIRRGIVNSLLALAYVWCAPSFVLAAFEREWLGVSSVGRGGVGLAWADGQLDGFANPALRGRGFSTGFGQEYGLKEFTHEGATTGIERGHFGMGAALDRIGDDRYAETRIGASASHDVAAGRWSVGASGVYHRLEIKGLETGSAFGVTVGAVGTLGESVRGALVWRNISAPRLSRYEDRLPESIAAGVMAGIDRRTRAGIDVIQEEGFPLDMRGGIETDVHKILTLRFGARTQPVQYAAGLGVRFRSLQVNYAMNWHPELGASHAAGLDILW